MYLIKLYAFIWRLRIFNPILRFLKFDYNVFTKQILKIKKNLETTKSFPVKCVVSGYTMNLDLARPTNRAIYFNSVYERKNVAIVKKYLKKNNCFIDIGAHVGYFSLIASQIVGDTGKVISFEPNFVNFKGLQQHFVSNNILNTVACNKAVSNQNAELIFYVNPMNDGGNSLNKFTDCNPLYEERVNAVRLDDFLENNFPSLRIDFIKIDVEGHQMDVLSGMYNTLEKYKPFLLIEYSSDENLREIKNLLSPFGYNSFEKAEFIDIFCSAK